MTTLPVTLGDQTLIAMEKVKIASGDIESVFLKVEFDENWAEFTARSASFYTSHDATAQEIMLIDNQCTIPADLLAQPGTLYIGIVGATTDGSAVKTSSVTGFRIVQGANHAYTTIKPKMDMYQQFLAAVKEEHSPLLNAMRTEMNGKYADFTSRITEALETLEENMLDTLNGEVVWTNDDDTQTFERQTIKLDLSEYKKVVIRFKQHTTDSALNAYSESACSVKGVKYGHFTSGTSSNANVTTSYNRNFVFRDTGVDFVNGTRNGDQNDNVCIPVEIRAFKY